MQNALTMVNGPDNLDFNSLGEKQSPKLYNLTT